MVSISGVINWLFKISVTNFCRKEVGNCCYSKQIISDVQDFKRCRRNKNVISRIFKENKMYYFIETNDFEVLPIRNMILNLICNKYQHFRNLTYFDNINFKCYSV